MIEGNRTGSDRPPRVSVIMPAYRAAPFIAEALASVLAQTFQDFEILVVNDGSPDQADLEAALSPFASRIRYFDQPNRGVSAARNYAIHQARGSFVAFLDSDDAWLPQYLDTQVRFLDQNPSAVAAVSDVLLFGDPVGSEVRHEWLRPGMGQLLGFEDMICRRAGQLPSATVVRRTTAIAAGLFDEQMRLGEDIEFSMRICFCQGMIGYTKQALAKYRKNPDGAVAKLSPRDITQNERECLLRIGSKLPLESRQRTVLEREIAGLQAELAMIDVYEDLAHQQFHKAAKDLKQANRYYRDKRILLAMVALKIFPRWTSRLLLARKHGRQMAKAHP